MQPPVPSSTTGDSGAATVWAFFEEAMRQLPSMMFVKDARTLRYVVWNDAAGVRTAVK